MTQFPYEIHDVIARIELIEKEIKDINRLLKIAMEGTMNFGLDVNRALRAITDIRAEMAGMTVDRPEDKKH